MLKVKFKTEKFDVEIDLTPLLAIVAYAVVLYVA